MLISWVEKLTLLDYPGKTACIVFTLGCNLRCRFCHNPEFVLPESVQTIKSDCIPEEIFFRFLEKRVWKLDGVSICWGEPTLQMDIVPFIRRIKGMGFSVKLDTNGTNPKVLKELLDEWLLDFVAMDVKVPLQEYAPLCSGNVPPNTYQESIDMIIARVPNYEFRTTIIQWVHSKESVLQIAGLIRGAKMYVLQNFRPEKTLDPEFSGMSFTKSELEVLANVARTILSNVEVRM